VGQPLVVAVSGGVDSVALLHWLVHQSAYREHLHVASFDHQLRPGSADDVAFVAELCTAWRIPFSAGNADVGAYAAQHHFNVEQAARTKRYAFLADVAHRIGSRVVVTAHHADDQAETVLLNLVRGAGVHGLEAMQVTSPLPYDSDLTLFRPLLTTSRADLEAYCQENNLTPRKDPTNLDTTFVRNRIRHEIMPQLRTINSQVGAALNQLADIAGLQQDFIRQMVDEHCLSSSQIEDDYTIIPRDDFLTLHPALQQATLHMLLEKDVTYDQIHHAVKVAQSGHTGNIAEFSGGRVLAITYDGLVVGDLAAYQEHVTRHYPQMQVSDAITIQVPGRTLLTEGIVPFAFPDLQLALQPTQSIAMRTRRSGDTFGSKRLKTVLINWKVPHFVRDRLPLIAIDKRVIAVLLENGWRVDPHFIALSKPGFFVNFSWSLGDVMVAKIDGIMYS